MIQSALFFLLGFTGASFLALLVAPSVWRRAVYLTRKRIESSVPLTVNELQADKDRMRAEHAISTRKLEIKQQENIDSIAKLQSHVSRLEADIKALNADIASKKEALENGARNAAEQATDIAERNAEIATLQLQVETMQADLAARNGELETFKRMHNENQKRIAAMIGRIEQDNADLGQVKASLQSQRDQRKQEQVTLRENRSRAKELEQLLKSERQKAATLETQLEKAIRSSSDLEEKLARRERDMARNRETTSLEAMDLSEFERRAEDAEAERAVLEEELAELTIAHNALEKKLAAASQQPAPDSDAAALEIRLGQALAELQKVTAERDAAVADRTVSDALSELTSDSSGDEELREQVNQLAAEMVHLTAMLEGENTPIDALLGKTPAPNGSNVVSLADRIGALRASVNKAAE